MTYSLGITVITGSMFVLGILSTASKENFLETFLFVEHQCARHQLPCRKKKSEKRLVLLSCFGIPSPVWRSLFRIHEKGTISETSVFYFSSFLCLMNPLALHEEPHDKLSSKLLQTIKNTYSGGTETESEESFDAFVLCLKSTAFQICLGYLLFNRNKMGPGGSNEKSKVNEKTC